MMDRIGIRGFVRHSTLAIAATFALTVAPAAHAGDGPTHTAAAEAGTMSLRAGYGNGIGVPAGDRAVCDMQAPKMYVPGSPAAPAVGNRPEFASDEGINTPDVWPCWSNDYDLMPPALSYLVGLTAGVTTSYLINGMGDKVYMACNFTHFEKNVMGAGATAAEVRTRKWADEIITDIKSTAKRYEKGHFCDGQTWKKFWKRHMNANHFIQDVKCEHHAPWGNLKCSTKTSFYSKSRRGCLKWLKAVNSAGVNRSTVRCDEEVIRPAGNILPSTFSGQMIGVNGGCRVLQQGAACAGLERTMRHHCDINPTGKACAGLTGNAAYCECTDPGYITAAGNVTTPAMQKAIDDWEDTCKEPTDPCEPTACQQWCERSTRLASSAFSSDGLRANGYCVNSDCSGSAPGPGEGDDECALHNCVCVVASGDDDGCGQENQPCCKPSEAATKCEDETEFACDPETNYCVQCGRSNCKLCCPGLEYGCDFDAGCVSSESCYGEWCDAAPFGDFSCIATQSQ